MYSDGQQQTRARLSVGWIVVTVVLVLALVGVGLFATVTYERASRWQAQSEQFEAELEETSAELEDTRGTLEETQGTLDETEQELADREDEVADLEGRVSEVAAEREQARDEVARLNDDLDLAASVVDQLSAIGVDLSICVDDLFQWIGQPPHTYDTEATWDAYFDRGAAIAEVCAQARDDFDTFLRATQP